MRQCMFLGVMLLLWILYVEGINCHNRKKRQLVDGMPICNQGPLKCLLQFQNILQYRFHFDIIKGFDRYVTGRDTVVENKEVEEYVEESNMIKEELMQQRELEDAHSLLFQEEAKYMNKIIEFWQKINKHSLTNDHQEWMKSYGKTEN